MGTLKKRIEDPGEIDDPNVVKVVTDRFENAIYFSRSTIPYQREKNTGGVIQYKHIGLYVYRRDFLLRYPALPVGPLEKSRAPRASPCGTPSKTGTRSAWWRRNTNPSAWTHRRIWKG